LNGWGGIYSWLVTGGAAGSHSSEVWYSVIGLIALLNGIFNLLPLAGLNGSHVVVVALEAIFERQAAEIWFLRYALLTYPLVLSVLIRMLYADVMWIVRR
jgi:membrane-associated protease RseP (regulator of RpoE activity)